MKDAVLNELKTLVTILGQCIKSFCEDLKTTDCHSPALASKTLIPSIIFKLEKLIECARAIQRICKSLRKDSTLCLPCRKKSSDSVESKIHHEQ